MKHVLSQEKSMLVKLLCLFIFCLSSFAIAAETATPEAIEGGRVVAVEEAKACFDTGKALFVDVRNPLNYGRGHIPKAVAAPFGSGMASGLEKGEFLRKLPGDKSGPIIIYSHGRSGWKSYNAAVEAIKAGYTGVMWMRDGFSSWEENGFESVPGPETR